MKRTTKAALWITFFVISIPMYGMFLWTAIDQRDTFSIILDTFFILVFPFALKTEIMNFRKGRVIEDIYEMLPDEISEPFEELFEIIYHPSVSLSTLEYARKKLKSRTLLSNDQ